MAPTFDYLVVYTPAPNGQPSAVEFPGQVVECDDYVAEAWAFVFEAIIEAVNVTLYRLDVNGTLTALFHHPGHGSALVSPDPAAGTGSTPAPTAHGNASSAAVTPSAVTGTGTAPAPTLASSTTVSPGPAAGTGTVAAATPGLPPAVFTLALTTLDTTPLTNVPSNSPPPTSASVTPDPVAGVGLVLAAQAGGTPGALFILGVSALPLAPIG